MYIMHLLYETHTRGLYQAEFLFSANTLVPISRNIPHAELDVAFRASRQTSLILDWLSNFIVEKALLGDSQVSLFWVQNRLKRTTSFIRNRVHLINRDAEVFYLETKQNPSDLGTKFNSFEDSYLKMTDTSTFRTGPAFMKDGLAKAKLNNNIINISDMTVDPQSKNVATA